MGHTSAYGLANRSSLMVVKKPHRLHHENVCWRCQREVKCTRAHKSSQIMIKRAHNGKDNGGLKLKENWRSNAISTIVMTARYWVW